MGSETEEVQMTRHGWVVNKANPQLWGLMSAERLELSTNGLKGQRPEKASPIQWPAIFA
jgi:hypothetical protein